MTRAEREELLAAFPKSKVKRILTGRSGLKPEARRKQEKRVRKRSKKRRIAGGYGSRTGG